MRVGLFGGSFDPVHSAHLKLASAALAQLKLDRVYFVLTPRSPFKEGKTRTPASLRLKMLRLALGKSKKMRVALWELRRKGPAYTIDTLRRYKQIHVSHDLFFVMGSDAYAGLSRWKNPAGIRRLCALVIGRRPGASLAGAQVFLPGKTWVPAKQHAGMTILLKGVFPPVSSTAIRRQITEGKLAKGKVSPAVLKFIRQRNLYTHVECV